MNFLQKKHSYFFLLLPLIVMFSFLSCKKKKFENLPNIQEGTVVFYFHGTVSSQSLSLESGKNSCYMYSDVQYYSAFSSFVFSGAFKSTTCSVCPNSLKIEMVDTYSASPSSSSNIQYFTQGTYSFYDIAAPSVSSYQMKVFCVPTLCLAPVSCTYNLNGNAISTASVFTYTVPLGTHTLTQYFKNNFSSCTNSLSNTFNLTPTDSFYAYYKYAVYSFSSTVGFSLFTNLPTSNSFTLDYGDTSVAISTSTYLIHYYPTNGWYSPTLYAKSNSGKLWVFTNNISTNIANQECLGNYYYNFQPIYGNPSPNSKIIITYRDENNILYSSQVASQPPNSFFTIQEISEYAVNENNQKTKKIKAQMKVRVYNPSDVSQYKDITGEAVFAVGYK